MQIDNFKVYDLAESIVASGLPMQGDYDPSAFKTKVLATKSMECGWDTPVADKEFTRACTLANNAPGTGHNNFLSGILVSCNVTATNTWWLQCGRYHFLQIVSSQSKMHRLKKLLEHDTVKGVNPKVLKVFKSLVNDDSVDFTELVNSCPLGIELTARITTNYLQLKTIYRQRKHHKLQEWRDFCEFIEGLPFAKEFIIGDYK